jgi:hypothetical protein
MFMENGWKPNAHMPPHHPGSLAKDLEQLLEAWHKGPAAVKGAKWVIPPAAGKESQVVGEDYPYKALFKATSWDKKPMAPAKSGKQKPLPGVE